MKIVPLDRSHVDGAAALHKDGVVWFYRGSADPAVLTWFYDAYANRDFTFGAVASEGRDAVAAAVACTDLRGAERWLLSRRRCRSAAARRRGGPDMTRGGVSPAAFGGGLATSGKAAFLVAVAYRSGTVPSVITDLFRRMGAAAASRGVTAFYAPAEGAPSDFASYGFERREDLWIKRL